MGQANTLEARLQRLEDIEEIKRLIAIYAKGADRQNDPDILRVMYAEDAVWEAEGMMRLEGREHLLAELHRFGKARIPWSLHFNTQPFIEVAEDGRTATMIWYVWETANVVSDGGDQSEPWVAGGWYESDLVKTKDGWKFKHIRLFLKLFGRRDAAGWNIRM